MVSSEKFVNDKGKEIQFEVLFKKIYFHTGIEITRVRAIKINGEMVQSLDFMEDPSRANVEIENRKITKLVGMDNEI